MSETAEAFQRLISSIDYPMFIVTVAAGGERAGCLVGFGTQASIEPARLLVMVSKANRTCRIAEHASAMLVHFLHDRNLELARLFGEESGDDVDKFASCRWKVGVDGTPVLLGVRGWVAGVIVARFDTGDHVAHLLDVTAADMDVVQPGQQLGYQAVRDFAAGHPAP